MTGLRKEPSLLQVMTVLTSLGHPPHVRVYPFRPGRFHWPEKIELTERQRQTAIVLAAHPDHVILVETPPLRATTDCAPRAGHGSFNNIRLSKKTSISAVPISTTSMTATNDSSSPIFRIAFESTSNL